MNCTQRSDKRVDRDKIQRKTRRRCATTF